MAPVFVEGLSGVGSPRKAEPPPPTRGAPSSDPDEPPPRPQILMKGGEGRLGEDRLEEMAKEAARILRVDRVAVWSFPDSEGPLRCLVRHHRREGTVFRPGAQSTQVSRAFRETLTAEGTVVSEDSPRNGPDVLRGWIADEGIRAFIAEPLRADENLLGLVTFEEDRGPRRWTPHARELAASLAGQIGRALREPAASSPSLRPAPEEKSDRSEAHLTGAPHVAPDDQDVAGPAPGMLETMIPSDRVAKSEALPSSDERSNADAVPPAPTVRPSEQAVSADGGPSIPAGQPPAGRPHVPVESDDPGPSVPVAPSEALPSLPVERGHAGPSVPAELRRLSQLEGAALLAAETIPDLLQVLELQRGSFHLLQDALVGREGELDLLAQATEATRRVESKLQEFLSHLRNGVGGTERVELNAILSHMIAALAAEAGDTVRLRVAPSADPIALDANSGLLERALVHLVRNSRQSAPAGTEVRISWGRVFASGAGEPGDATATGFARIRVEDRGEGIPPGQLPWVLEPFYSLRGRESGQTGLGLAVVRAIVEGHGGWLEVKSRAGEGTVVDLFLPTPTQIAVGTTASETARDAVGPTPTRSGPWTVLILEDEPLLAQLIEHALARCGYRTEVAAAPIEAERRWRRLGDGLDLVLAERELAGGRSGVDLIRRWRREDPSLRAVVLDRRSDPESRLLETQEEEFPVLRRPFDPAEVVKCVREVLADRGTETAVEEPGVAPSTAPPSAPASPSPSIHPESSGPTGRMLAH